MDKLLIFYIFYSWIYIDFNLFKSIRTWWKVRKFIKFPKIKFYYGTDIHTGNIFLNYMSLHRKILNITCYDVCYKLKNESICYEAPPFISVILFRKYRLLWTFISPDHFFDTSLYWELILELIYDYNYDIQELKKNFNWYVHHVNPDGSIDKIPCWRDEILTNYSYKLIYGKSRR